MQLAVQRLVIPRSIRIDLTEQTPEAVNETPCTFNPCFGPRQIALGWAVRQHEPANGVSAILFDNVIRIRSEEHTSELQSLMRISYAVFCLKKKKTKHKRYNRINNHDPA